MPVEQTTLCCVHSWQLQVHQASGTSLPWAMEALWVRAVGEAFKVRRRATGI